MQDYNTIIGSIQMRLNGCQTRSVMDRYKIGSGTLNLIMSRYHANGIPIEELRMMAPKEVENLFYPQKNLQRKDVPLPDLLFLTVQVKLLLLQEPFPCAVILFQVFCVPFQNP